MRAASLWLSKVIHLEEEVSELKYLVDATNVNTIYLATDDENDPLLLRASLNGNEQGVAYLLSVGAYVNATNARGKTALMYAKTKGILQLLLDHGAHVNVMDRNGETPLSEAVHKEKWEIVKVLLDYRALNGRINHPSEHFHDLVQRHTMCRVHVQRLLVVRSKSAWLCKDVMVEISKHLWSMRFK